MKGGARCKCEHGAKCKCGVKCKHEHEVKAQSEMCPVGCILFIPFLSVCTGDISTKAMVGVDVVAQVL